LRIIPLGIEAGLVAMVFNSNDEYTKNLANVQKAVSLLNGPDNGATRVWWDKKNK